MLRPTLGRAARFLAMLAITVQAILPGALAVAEAQGVDVARFLCAPSGGFSSESRGMGERLADLLNEGLDDQTGLDEGCPLCTLGQAALISQPFSVSEPLEFTPEAPVLRHEPGLVHKAHGPPVGSRGPPTYI